MGDWANAVVKFRVKPHLKDAVSYVLDKQHKRCKDGMEWFDYFNFITTDGKIALKHFSDHDYIDILDTGYNINLYAEFSLGEVIEQKIEDDIVTLKMARKWADIRVMTNVVENNLEELGDELLFCEIIAYDNKDEEYYRVSFAPTEINSEFFKLTETSREKIVFGDDDA